MSSIRQSPHWQGRRQRGENLTTYEQYYLSEQLKYLNLILYAFSPDTYMEQGKNHRTSEYVYSPPLPYYPVCPSAEGAWDLESLTNSQPLPVHRSIHLSVSIFLCAFGSSVSNWPICCPADGLSIWSW